MNKVLSCFILCILVRIYGLVPHVRFSSLTTLHKTCVSSPPFQCSQRPSLKMDVSEGISSYLNIPDEAILRAVEKSGSKLTVQDLSAVSGIEISKARSSLQNLASLTGGDLEVTESGEIVYNFPSNFRAILRQRNTSVRVREVAEKVWPYVFYGIRVGFGLVLIASILVIFTAIIVISSSSNSNEDDRRRGNRGTAIGVPRFSYWGPTPFDFFYYRPYYGYYSTPIEQRERLNEMGFLESTFSYIFGDGDPNSNIEKERLTLIASVIRANGGAVTAEQLAPFLDPPENMQSGPNLGSVVDESFVLPAVTALQGIPKVTEDGDIVYVFPELQTTALESMDPELRGLESKSPKELKYLMEKRGVASSGFFEKVDMVGRLRETQSRSDVGYIEPYLSESKIEFSVAKTSNVIGAAVLGVVNLGGALYLRNLLSNAAISGLQLGGYGIALQGIMPFLLTYAVAFNVIPLVRWFRNKSLNEKIEKRNAVRSNWAKILNSGNAVVRRKISAAKLLSSDLKVIANEDITYSTTKDLSEQRREAFTESLEDFDKRLSQ